jgi:hypothetical protein
MWFTELTINNKRAGDIDNTSVAASEGIPPYRVTFDVSEQDEAGDASSLLGDGQFTHKPVCVILLKYPFHRNADN